MVTKTIEKTSKIFNGDAFDKVDNPYCTTTLAIWTQYIEKKLRFTLDPDSSGKLV